MPIEKEYRIDVKVRNNVILYKIEQAGYKTLGELCRVNNVMKYVSVLADIIAMKRSPLMKDGDFKPCIKWLADLLQCSELDFFTDTQLHTILKTNKRHIAVNEAEMKFMIQQDNQHKMLDDIISDGEFVDKVDEQLNTLTPRERKVLAMRFGIGNEEEKTLEECGRVIGVNRERVRQIESKALRKLRHPSRANELKEYLNNGADL